MTHATTARGHHYLGFDVGGTFTDVLLVDGESGQFWLSKPSTTHGDLTLGIIRGIDDVLEAAHINPEQVVALRHGTTVVTNTILESKGADTVLITTAGFRDVLAIGRHDIPRQANVYAWTKPERPVKPRDILEVEERIAGDGSVVVPLSPAETGKVVEALRKRRPQSVAISLINAYVNTAHEEALARVIVDAIPEIDVSTSSSVIPTYREFERSMTCTLNAYVMPPTRQYMSRLEPALRDRGFTISPEYMQSNGGVISRDVAQSFPIRMAMSGPAAGVVGATRAGSTVGAHKTISVDIGGTSADIALSSGGAPSSTVEGRIGAWPVHIPMLDISTIGAGGGSIAQITLAGSLKVGPESAGSIPGPAAYSRGGTLPTVTDAHVVLGRIPSGRGTGDSFLDRGAAERAIEEHVAAPLSISVLEAAESIIRVANHNMATAVRAISVERGIDPGDFALVALGGGGALHATELSELLDVSTVIVPPTPGVLATLGLLQSASRNVFTASLDPTNGDWGADLAEALNRLVKEAEQWMEDAGIPELERKVNASLYLRYPGQGHELSIELRDLDPLSVNQTALVDEFHSSHETVYSFANRGDDVQATALRITASGAAHDLTPKVPFAPKDTHSDSPQHSLYIDGRWAQAEVVDRSDLYAGWTSEGATLIRQPDTTVFVPPSWHANAESDGTITLKRS